jgi:protein gp37
MGQTSAIEWTSATYNPWRGCDKVSPGCAHCYMFSEQRRYGRDPSVVVRCSDATFYAPLRKRAWRELPEGALVFTCSWSDWFHEDADPWRDEAWDVIRQRPDLTWQILTKRPERALEHLPADWGAGWPHVWMGVTIENRRFVDRADLLRAIPAAMRFISAEPLLGPLVRDGWAADGRGRVCDRWWQDGYEGADLDLTRIDWLIAGGESGARCRPMRLEWARDLRDACAEAGTAFFLKQLGGHPNKRGGGLALLDGRRHVALPEVAVAG